MGKNETNYEGAHDTVMTPRYLLEPLTAGLGPIGLDPCSNPSSVVESALAILLHSYHPQRVPGAARTIYGDGLKYSWDRRDLVFVNPPYSDLEPWGAKMRDEGDELVGLLPLRTGNAFWLPTFGTAAVECRLRRVTHEGEKTHAPFHQGLLYWGDRSDRAAEVFEGIGGPGSVRLHPRLTRPVWSFPRPLPTARRAEIEELLHDVGSDTPGSAFDPTVEAICDLLDALEGRPPAPRGRVQGR